VDHWGVITQAWAITRRSRPLLGLGAISAAQTLIFIPVFVAMIVPLMALPRLVSVLAALQQAPGSGAEPASPALAEQIASVSQSVLDRLPVIASLSLVVLVLWILLAVFDVASQAGMVRAASASLEDRAVSVSSAMREGFGLWWRTAYLLAIAAMPALIMLTAVAIAFLFTYSLPLSRGQMPSAAAGAGMQLVFGPLQTVASVLGAALGVIAQISLRFAVLDDVHWREAWARGWALTRSCVTDALVVYLFVAVLAGLASTVAIAACVAVGAAFVTAGVGLAAVAGSAVGTVVGAVGVIAASAGYLLFSAVLLAWTSTVWTVLWRRLAGRDGAGTAGGAPAGASA
jgi:hypothetical protein